MNLGTMLSLVFKESRNDHCISDVLSVNVWLMLIFELFNREHYEIRMMEYSLHLFT